MSSQHDSALMRRQLYTLSSDALFILARASLGQTDKEIIRAGAGWKFTKETIERSFKEASKVFGFESFTDPRGAVLSYVRLCRDLGFMRPPSQYPVSEKPTHHTRSVEENVEMNTTVEDTYNIAESVKLIPHLSALQNQILRMLASGANEDAVKRKFTLEQVRFEEMLSDILTFLKIPQKEGWQRRRALACDAMKRFQAQHNIQREPEQPASQKRPAVFSAPRSEPARSVPVQKGVSLFEGKNINTPEMKLVLVETLSALLKARSMKLPALAEKTHIHISFFGNLRSGAGMLSVERLTAIAHAFGVSPAFLLKETSKEPKLIAEELARMCDAGKSRTEEATPPIPEVKREEVSAPPVTPIVAVAPPVTEAMVPKETSPIEVAVVFDDQLKRIFGKPELAQRFA